MSVELVWTSQEDWEECALTDCDTTTVPGSVLIAVGERMGVVETLATEVPSFLGHSRCVVYGKLPLGANIVLRYRIGASESAVGEATWSNWLGGWVFVDTDTREARTEIDLLLDLLNRAVDDTGLGWFQYQVRLYRG